MFIFFMSVKTTLVVGSPEKKLRADQEPADIWCQDILKPCQSADRRTTPGYPARLVRYPKGSAPYA